MSMLANLKPVAPDPLVRSMQLFAADSRPHKVNLGVGVYYDDSSKIPVLKAVKEAEKRLQARKAPWAYLSTDGLDTLRHATVDLVFGDAASPELHKCTMTAQTPGGTGAVRLGMELVRKLVPDAVVAISRPSWPNHRSIIEAVGLRVTEYAYYDPAHDGVRFDEMMSDIERLPEGSVVVLHGCCHNPTGNDLLHSQWSDLILLMRRRGLIPFIDMAYQGFGGGLHTDSWAVSQFAHQISPVFVAASFSKSFSLYGERVGVLCVSTAKPEQAQSLAQQARVITRVLHSSPPSHGAYLVSEVLNDPELRASWETELGSMRTRIQSVRREFVERLHQGNPTQDFSFVTEQRGLFSFTKLTAAQVDRLRKEFAIHAVPDGRICVAAINSGNIDRVANAIRGVVTPV